jgi:hypothetical protein
LFRLAQLLGLLSLLGQRVPDAITEFLTEVRDQTVATAEYHAQLDRRLASLPQDITEGVDIGAIAKGMAEAFRQQIASTGLENTATLLRNASREMTALTGQITASLRPVARDYKNVAETISGEIETLTAASDRLQQRNSQLLQRERKSARLWLGVLTLVLFLAGGICGIFIEKRQTTDVLSKMGTQIQQLCTSALPNPNLHLRKDQIQ